MTEIAFARQFQYEPDEDDVRAQDLLAKLQARIDQHTLSDGLPIHAHTAEEQQQIVDKMDAYIKFEAAMTGDLLVGMPVAFTGPGLFLGAHGGEVSGAESMLDDDILVGEVDGISSLPVPTREVALTPKDLSINETPVDEKVLSVIVELQNARLFRGVTPEGTYDHVFDLSSMTIIAPVAYSMPFRVLDVTPLHD